MLCSTVGNLGEQGLFSITVKQSCMIYPTLVTISCELLQCQYRITAKYLSPGFMRVKVPEKSEKPILYVQGKNLRRASCRCPHFCELFLVGLDEYMRILAPLEQTFLQERVTFLRQVGACNWLLVSAFLFLSNSKATVTAMYADNLCFQSKALRTTRVGYLSGTFCSHYWFYSESMHML